MHRAATQALLTQTRVEKLLAAGVVSKPRDGVKILGVGELTAKLSFEVYGASKSALEAIERTRPLEGFGVQREGGVRRVDPGAAAGRGSGRPREGPG